MIGTFKVRQQCLTSTVITISQQLLAVKDRNRDFSPLCMKYGSYGFHISLLVIIALDHCISVAVNTCLELTFD